MSKITAKPVDLSPILDQPDRLASLKNRIHMVGIELEGGWKSLPKGVNLTPDSSVRFEPQPMTGRLAELYQAIQYGTLGGCKSVKERDDSYRVLYAEWMSQFPEHVGEYPSVPIELKHWEEWIRQSYPSHVNHTCGLHVHMSFASGKRKNDALIYQRLMDPAFTSTLLAEFTKWAGSHKDIFHDNHHIWKRLLGQGREGEFCQVLFHADSQVKQARKVYDHHGNGHRYTAVNYCWAMHQTLEFRTLPMMETVDLAVEAIKLLLLSTNAFLVLNRVKEDRVRITIPADDIYYTDTVHLSV